MLLYQLDCKLVNVLVCSQGSQSTNVVFSLQTKDIIEYLKRLSKTSIPDGIIKFIGVYIITS